MLKYLYFPILAAGLIGLLVGFTATASAQPPAPPALPAPPVAPDGVEVLARGPIHEAFAEPVNGLPQPGAIVAKQPPPQIEEVPPDMAPSGDMQWIPGYWAWDDERKDYFWISGIWRQAPPDRQWVPGHWMQAATGWQWTPGFWTALAQKQIEYLPPPPAPLDAAPSTPPITAASLYIPGNWFFVQNRYAWRPGFWLEPRPGWIWIPAHFVWTPVGYVFVDGYWDLDLSRRGLLFAPVYFNTPLYRRPGWFYRPSFVVQNDFLMGALFVRPGFSSYYFGDYFNAAYTRRGFVAWTDVRYSRAGFDPLFGYYRWNYRDVGRWETDLRGLYAGRFNGTIVRPPQTLVQQTTVVAARSNVGGLTVAHVNQVNALASLTQIKQKGVVTLQQVSPQRLAAEKVQIKQFESASSNRRVAELGLAAHGGPAVHGNEAPRTVRLNLPDARPVLTGAPKPPPPPHDTKALVVHPEPPKAPPSGKTTGVPLNPPPTSLPPASGAVKGALTDLHMGAGVPPNVSLKPPGPAPSIKPPPPPPPPKSVTPTPVPTGAVGTPGAGSPGRPVLPSLPVIGPRSMTPIPTHVPPPAPKRDDKGDKK
jgi:WXXGXW repeat (2 copies)